MSAPSIQWWSGNLTEESWRTTWIASTLSIRTSSKSIASYKNRKPLRRVKDKTTWKTWVNLVQLFQQAVYRLLRDTKELNMSRECRWPKRLMGMIVSGKISSPQSLTNLWISIIQISEEWVKIYFWDHNMINFNNFSSRWSSSHPMQLIRVLILSILTAMAQGWWCSNQTADSCHNIQATFKITMPARFSRLIIIHTLIILWAPRQRTPCQKRRSNRQKWKSPSQKAHSWASSWTQIQLIRKLCILTS